MGINVALAEQIKQEISGAARGERGTIVYHPVSLSQVLRENFQAAADKEMNGNFSNLLEAVLRLYLEDPQNYPVCWVSIKEGAAKNKPVSLTEEVVQGIKEKASVETEGVFARLVQIIIRGYLVDRGYLQLNY